MTAPQLATQAVAVIEAAGGRLHYMKAYPSAAEVAALAGSLDAVAILSRQGPVLAAAMDAAPGLRIIARHGVGVDDVDVAEAVRRGIVVARAPGSNTTAVAEHTMAMILALVKQLAPLSATVAGGGWRGAAQVRDLAGLRLGLLGCGGIGQAVARFARGFGMEVAGFSRGGQGGDIPMLPSLDALLARSDVLSLHLPMSPAARHVIDARALALLPDQAIVVNTARGGLIDEAALLAALEAGRLAGAGLD
ncbi:MAG: NAD(P)-dependent oxidoreductase, partial [Janthinobacterium lividum]